MKNCFRYFIFSAAALVFTLHSTSRLAAADNFLDSPIAYSFVQALSQYYGIPQQQVVVVHDRGIRDEELPVVFLVSQNAHVEPVQVVDLRSRGMSWSDILGHFGLSPTIFSVPYVPEDVGPPYGNAYGYWRKHRRPTVVYSDDDLVKFGNVYFLNHYYHEPPASIIRLHRSSNNFLVINHTYADKHGRKFERHEDRHDHEDSKCSGDNKHDKHDDDQGKVHGKEHGKGNGKGHGHGKH